VDFESRRAYGFKVSTAPARYQTVRQALEAGPLYFSQLMAALGSKDGREVALAIDALREEGILGRMKEGQWALLSTPGAEREQKN
jgi:2,5-furandicarboxylate decarboxylase 1